MPNEDYKYQLILEKISNLNDRLVDELGCITNRFCEHTKEDDSNFRELKDNCSKLIDKIDRILLDTEKGVVVRLDRLEQSDKKRVWFMKTVFGGTLASVLAHIWNLFKN